MLLQTTEIKWTLVSVLCLLACFCFVLSPPFSFSLTTVESTEGRMGYVLFSLNITVHLYWKSISAYNYIKKTIFHTNPKTLKTLQTAAGSNSLCSQPSLSYRYDVVIIFKFFVLSILLALNNVEFKAWFQIC